MSPCPLLEPLLVSLAGQEKILYYEPTVLDKFACVRKNIGEERFACLEPSQSLSLEKYRVQECSIADDRVWRITPNAAYLLKHRMANGTNFIVHLNLLFKISSSNPNPSSLLPEPNHRNSTNRWNSTHLDGIASIRLILDLSNINGWFPLLGNFGTNFSTIACPAGQIASSISGTSTSGSDLGPFTSLSMTCQDGTVVSTGKSATPKLLVNCGDLGISAIAIESQIDPEPKRIYGSCTSAPNLTFHESFECPENTFVSGLHYYHDGKAISGLAPICIPKPTMAHKPSAATTFAQIITFVILGSIGFMLFVYGRSKAKNYGVLNDTEQAKNNNDIEESVGMLSNLDLGTMNDNINASATANRSSNALQLV